jgi:SAM-dependent methyltransferase
VGVSEWMSRRRARAIFELEHEPSPTPLLRPESYDDRLDAFVEAVNASGGTYHTLYLSDRLVISGIYDMTRYSSLYGIPEDLRGWRVLDVGSASGYFAFECGRRGASVTAIDVYEHSLLADLLRILDVDIRYEHKSVYDLTPEDGRFDLVICGSLLLHLSDQLGAIRALGSVCARRLVVSTACLDESTFTERPLCEFHGVHAPEGGYWNYWSLSAAALRRMLLASGFAGVEDEHHFLLKPEPGHVWSPTQHVVMTGLKGSEHD